MSTKRIAKNRTKRAGGKGAVLNQFFHTLIKNRTTPLPEVKNADEVQPKA